MVGRTSQADKDQSEKARNNYITDFGTHSAKKTQINNPDGLGGEMIGYFTDKVNKTPKG